MRRAEEKVRILETCWLMEREIRVPPVGSLLDREVRRALDGPEFKTVTDVVSTVAHECGLYDFETSPVRTNPQF